MRFQVLHIFLLSLFVVSCTKEIPTIVPDQVMSKIYEEIKTPYKYGLILAPESNSTKIDCPTIFRKDDKWNMTFIVFNGRGYQTCLAESNNLTDWEILGPILSFSDTSDWDSNQKAGYPSLINIEWAGDYEINTYNNKYWMSYFGGNSSDIEKGLLSMGIASTENNPTSLHEWIRMEKPVLKSTDKDARWYDNSTMYKSAVYKDDDELTGYPFVMYYNARGDSLHPERGAERICMAVSNDMVNWKRFGEKPVLNHHVDITGDAMLQKIGDVFVMFFYRATWPGNMNIVYNSFACSYDLVHWTEWAGTPLIEPSEEFDKLFAHKACVIKFDGLVYHFYTAVDELGNRGIALATSKDIGKSPIKFNSTVESAIK